MLSNVNYLQQAKQLPAPVLILGAGGFIGVNLLQMLLSCGVEVVGVSHNKHNNWRLAAAQVAMRCIEECDITQLSDVEKLFDKIKPRTIFNLAAYGAYSKQHEYHKIYDTNFTAAMQCVEIAKKYGFDAYLQAGSSSEYGFNAAAPAENTHSQPNSHYAVSKTAVFSGMQYYGKIEKLPVIHARIYSAYGAWEEPDRLIPQIVAHARQGTFPPLVSPHVSRDFIEVSDVCHALIALANNVQPYYYGEAFNIGTGIPTTIAQLAQQVQTLFDITHQPVLGSMPDRAWDTNLWYADITKIKQTIAWEPLVTLSDGLQQVARWQQSVMFDNATWNWTIRQ